MMEENLELSQEPLGKLIWRYSIPAIIGMMVVALYNAIDRMFIGNIPNVGEQAIVGVGVTMPIASLIIAFEMLVGIGTSTIIAKKLGEGKREEAEKALGNALILGLVIGIGFTIVMFVFCEPLLKIFGASEASLIYGKRYISIILMGVTPYIVGFSLNTTIRATGNPRMAAITLIMSCLLNIILDPLFIFTFKLGIEGAAIATIISQCVVTIWVLYYYTKGKSFLKLKKANYALDRKLVVSILTIGASAFAMQVATSVVQMSANHALKIYGGDEAIGAMAVLSSISMIFLMPVFGINQGTLPIMGFNYGAGLIKRTRKTFVYALIWAGSILLIGTILVQLTPNTFIALFGDNKKLEHVATEGIRIYLSMFPLAAIAIVGANYFLAIGHAKASMFLSLLRQVIIFIPMLIVLPPMIGLKGIWIAQALSDVLAAIITIIYLKISFKDQKFKDNGHHTRD